MATEEEKIGAAIMIYAIVRHNTITVMKKNSVVMKKKVTVMEKKVTVMEKK